MLDIFENIYHCRSELSRMDQPRLETFCCRMRVTIAVSLLGWSGIIISTLAILVSFHMLSVFEDQVSLCLTPIIFFFLLIMNILLVKRNRAGKFSEVKRILSLELAVSLGPFISMVTLINLMALFETLYLSPLPLPVLTAIFLGSIILALVWMILAILAKEMEEMKTLVKAYIIFNIVLLVLQVVLLILLFTQRYFLVEIIPIVLMGTVYNLYHIGYIVVLHNIMDLSLDDGHEIKSDKI